MPQTILDEVAEFCEEMLLPIPGAVVGSADPNVRQIRALLLRAGNSLALRGEWSRLTHEEVHTTLAQEDQGSIYDITTGGTGATAFRKIKNETFWDRTDKLPIYPVNPIDWQRIKATISAQPRYKYRLVRGRLLMTPTPPAGHSLAFEWVSKWWIQDAVGTIKERFTADTDTFLVERELLKLGLTWRWKKAKGFDYTEEYEEYESRLSETLGHDVTRETLYMDQHEARARPGIWVPEYSWDVTT